jgi:transglutaminase-like putative cysteine protease
MTPATPSAVRADVESIHYRVHHRTAYAYSRPMTDGYTLAYVLPRPTVHQRVERAAVDVEPVPDERAERVDVFGNRVLQIGIHRAHETLVVDASSDVVVTPSGDVSPGPAWEHVAAELNALRGADALAVRPFVGASPYVDLDAFGGPLVDLARVVFTPGRPIVDAARALCHEIFTTFDYDPAYTETSTPLAAVLAGRRGVCQDFAHLAAGCLRSIGLAARYVSGYLETSPPPGRQRLVGADASHAWCSLWVPGQAWVDFDPTNDHLPTHRHVTVAWGRDYGDVTPVRGVVIGPLATQQLTVSVDVTRV